MVNKHPRQAITIYPDTEARIERLIARTSRRQNVILREALEQGLRQMEHQLDQLEHIAQKGY